MHQNISQQHNNFTYAQVAAEEIAAYLDGKPSRDGFMCKCPAHDDRSASLSVSTGNDGKTLIKCFAGCSFHEVINALGIEAKQLFPPSNYSKHDRKQYNHKLNRARTIRLLWHELIVLMSVVEVRAIGQILNKDKIFKRARPEYRVMPDEFWEREKLAAKRLKVLIGDLYG